MKLALASLAAFLAAYTGGGLLFVPREGAVSADSPPPDPSHTGGASPALSAMGIGTSTGGGTDLAAERDFLERVAQTASEDLAELYRSVMSNPRRADAVASHWAETDPSGMHAALKQMRAADPEKHGSARWYLFREWPKVDPDAAIAAARAWDRESRSVFDFLSTVILGLMESNPKAAVALLKEYPETGRWLVLPTWAKDDPTKAVELLGPLLYTKRFAYTLRTLALELAKKDPAGAIAWAGSLDWKSRSQVQFQIGKAALVNGDLETVRTLLGRPQFQQSELGGELGTDYASKLAEQDPTGALAWATQHLSGHSRANAMYRLIDHLAAEDLGAALKLYDGLPSGSTRDSIAGRLATTWAKQDRPAAIEWVGELEADARKRALRSIGSAWLKADAPAALAFAAEHADAQTLFWRQHASNLASRDNYSAALEWIATLPDSDTRTDVANDTLSYWAYQSPEKAAAFAASLPAGPGREQGIAVVAGRFSLISETQTLDWVRTLPAADHASVIEGIEKRVTNAAQKQRLLDAINSIAR